MAGSESGPSDVADFTLVWMPRVDTKLDKILEILVRHETRITRIERDVGEIKFDLTSFDTHFVTLTTDMLRLMDKVDAMDEKIDGLDRRVANIEGKLDITPVMPPA